MVRKYLSQMHTITEFKFLILFHERIFRKNYQSNYIILISKPELSGVSPDW